MEKSKSKVLTLSESSVVVASRNHVSCELGQEIVLLHLDSGLYFGLDNVGTRIWQLVQTPMKVAEILETVNREFSTPTRDVSEEIVSFLEDLNQQGLLEYAPADQIRAGDRKSESTKSH